ncbi:MULTISPECIES: hypothetical protein [Trueperella]|uniref:Uncharacterized protein n=2 Tax=Actinomycetaceae TaxID=2049 RepID=A0ABT9PJB9_9ACTO|nr:MULTISPECIES: hypothetical protein [Trueperella]MCI7305507.1 hypothetical protein [Trueperella sp.]MDP9832813.1 hypothetical protein [Trueperella abortisuis]
MMGFPPRLPDWEVYAGDDATLTLEYKTDDTPLDLSAWGNWRATWRPTLPGGSVDETAQPVALTVDASKAKQGLVAVTIPAGLSAVDGGKVREGAWDLQATNAGGVRTWARGIVRWMGDITR